MTIDDLKKYFKNSNQFEIETHMSHSNWVYWKKLGYIPIHSQMKIEKLTDGLLVAEFDSIPDGVYR